MRVDRLPPMQAQRFVADGSLATPLFGGAIVTSGAAACTVYIRHGQQVTSNILFTLKVDAAHRTVPFALPGPVQMPNGVFVDMDANTAEVVVLYW